MKTRRGACVSSVSIGEFLCPCHEGHAGIRVRGLTILQCDVHHCHRLLMDLF